VIPCLDGEKTVAAVIEKTRAHLPAVIVIDDGSTDRTEEVSKRAGAEVVRHSVNLGKGAALLSGLRAAKDRGFTHAVTLDSDGQHDPADIPKLLEASRAVPEGLVIGARDFNVPNVPGGSKFGRKFSNFWVWVETGTRLSDTQSGFRVYPVAETLMLPLKPSRFELEVEVIVRARWAGLPVGEAPIGVFYPPPAERISHYRGFKDSALISLLHFRLFPRSLLRPVWRPRRLLLSR
jgi:glycosyltransferase involved in cell wall biosynthesis